MIRAGRRARVLAFIALLASCTGSQIDPLDTSVVPEHPLKATPDPVHEPGSVSIRFGSSSGMCTGYCQTDFELHSWGLECWRRGWEAGGDTTKYPAQRQVVPLLVGRYKQVLAALDTVIYWNAPEVIGCPDCADGGSCWIRVTIDGRERAIDYDCVGGAGPHEQLANLLWGVVPDMQWSDPNPLFNLTLTPATSGSDQ
jgi:hypothetical protein